MTEINDGGPAFPLSTAKVDRQGMSLRDYFAAHAPTPPLEFWQGVAVTAGKDLPMLADGLARWSWEYADAMLRGEKR